MLKSGLWIRLCLFGCSVNWIDLFVPVYLHWPQHCCRREQRGYRSKEEFEEKRHNVSIIQLSPGLWSCTPVEYEFQCTKDKFLDSDDSHVLFIRDFMITLACQTETSNQVAIIRGNNSPSRSGLAFHLLRVVAKLKRTQSNALFLQHGSILRCTWFNFIICPLS